MPILAFELDDVEEQHRQVGKPWLEFLRVPSLSVGLYALPAGGTDPQSPHQEDEVYVVVRGRAMLRVADEDRPVRPGSIVFVGKGVEHRFHSIEEPLSVLVFFAPAHTA
jgi:mannose-6-phosphate isomerase-like protein (cupin superfamily)